MATASCRLSEEQFLCSICLDVFRDPVSLPCGHNFCKACIDQYWPVGARCTCPYCKKTFLSRPELQVNIFIAEMATHFRRSQHKPRRSSGPVAVDQEVLCDVCTVPKQAALKSCLICLSSYCEAHLEPHLNMSGLRRHQLLEPQRDLEKRVCVEHDKPLELFCLKDQLCVCVLCLHSKHKNHEVVPLKEASDQHKLQLQSTDDDIQEQINRRRKKIDELRESVKLSNAAADKEISDGVSVFTPLKKTVEKGLDLLISEITKKKTDMEQQAEGLIQELEQEVIELEKRGAELKLLSESDDPLLLLQKSSRLSLKSPTKDWAHFNISVPPYEGAVGRALTELVQDLKKIMRVYRQEQQRKTPVSPWKDLDPELKRLFEMCGISETDLEDAETSAVISDFIARKGGVEAVKKEIQRQAPPSPQRSLGPQVHPPSSSSTTGPQTSNSFLFTKSKRK